MAANHDFVNRGLTIGDIVCGGNSSGFMSLATYVVVGFTNQKVRLNPVKLSYEENVTYKVTRTTPRLKEPQYLCFMHSVIDVTQTTE